MYAMLISKLALQRVLRVVDDIIIIIRVQFRGDI